ncbi:MAG: tyrosine-type recombinase/integrase [Anaerolineales bacterium]
MIIKTSETVPGGARMNNLTFSQAIEGYLLNAGARHLSPHTVADYLNTFHKFEDYVEDDSCFIAISQNDIQEFLAAQTSLSNKTLLNYHTGLSALWSWAVKEQLVSVNVVKGIQPPRPEKRELVPFAENEIKAMLSALRRSRIYSRPGKRSSNHGLPDAERNHAILMLMLDTGIRASEVSLLKILDVDQRNQRIQVMGKGSKERSIPFSARTGQSLWRYLSSRSNARVGDMLFVTKANRPMDRTGLLKLLHRMGERAHVKDVHPHRFRHTFGRSLGRLVNASVDATCW